MESLSFQCSYETVNNNTFCQSILILKTFLVNKSSYFVAFEIDSYNANVVYGISYTDINTSQY